MPIRKLAFGCFPRYAVMKLHAKRRFHPRLDSGYVGVFEHHHVGLPIAGTAYGSGRPHDACIIGRENF
ncbi:hypothetical protein ACFQI7_08220 [Paenibacillus allorhizosphaerae]|uniref:hypothetical protein n=1 Tax=Paenibacillus allorhizosphaerae TaxID=2849866 RepID=UPI001C403D59|nr:hypothetical protein [Paenibacillus allorhizosphaerae]